MNGFNAYKHWKVYRAIQREDKLPRKIKKAFIGLKPTRRELKRMISEVHYLNPNITRGQLELSDYFCPKCGCRESRHVDHHVGYPEIWTQDFCARCGQFIGGQDNSWYEHILESYIPCPFE